MAEKVWAPGHNPPALTPIMKAAGHTWRKLNPCKGGFLWEVAPADRTAQAVAGSPSGAHSSRKGD